MLAYFDTSANIDLLVKQSIIVIIKAMEGEDEVANLPGTINSAEESNSVIYPKIQDIEDRNDNRRANANENTVNGTLPDPAAVSSSWFNFWDVNSYKRTVKRIDDGARLCDDLMKLLAERAEIEGLYATKLEGKSYKRSDVVKEITQKVSCASSFYFSLFCLLYRQKLLDKNDNFLPFQAIVML